MDLSNNLIKVNNNGEIKYYKTETNFKQSNFPKFHSMNKNIMKIFNYRLFKINESNKFLNRNKLCKHNSKDLFSNILVKNFNNNSIKKIHFLNENSMNNNSKNEDKITNYFNSQQNSIKNSMRTIPKHNNRIKYHSPKLNDIITKKKFNNKIDDKIKFGLFPLYYLNKNRGKFLYKKKFLNNNLYIEKIDYNNKNIDFDFLSKTNYTNNKGFLKKTKNKLNILKKKDNSDTKTEENDMKPKIRFINLKKDLLEENLKINRMFADFHKEIAEKEKSLKFIGKHKIKSDKIIILNNF